MRDLLLRILRRSIPVALVLGIMGYLFAELFLMLHQMNGGVQDPANDSVRWRTPLTMASFGIILLAGMEILLFVIRGNKTKAVEKPAVTLDAEPPPTEPFRS